MFSIADIQAEQEAEFEELEEGEEASEDQPAHSYPIRCSFAITKVSLPATPCSITLKDGVQNGTPGALTIDAMCQDGTFVTDNISFYPDAKVGTELTAEADWKRRGLYIGPQVCCGLSSPCSCYLLPPFSLTPSMSPFRRNSRSF